jgi:hypothetical protein
VAGKSLLDAAQNIQAGLGDGKGRGVDLLATGRAGPVSSPRSTNLRSALAGLPLIASSVWHHVSPSIRSILPAYITGKICETAVAQGKLRQKARRGGLVDELYHAARNQPPTHPSPRLVLSVVPGRPGTLSIVAGIWRQAFFARRRSATFVIYK